MMQMIARFLGKLPTICAVRLTGFVLGTWLAWLVMSWTLLMGTTLPVISATLPVCLIGLLLGMKISPQLNRLGCWRDAILALGLAFGLQYGSLGIHISARWLGNLSIDLLASPGMLFTAMLPIACLVWLPVLIGVGAWLAMREGALPQQWQRGWWGLGMGMILAPQTLFVWFPPQTVISVLVGLCLGRVVLELSRQTGLDQSLIKSIGWAPLESAVQSLSVTSRISGCDVSQKSNEQMEPVLPGGSRSGLHRLAGHPIAGNAWLATGAAAAILAGGSLAIGERIWSQCFVSQVTWILTLLGVICLGVWLGGVVSDRRWSRAAWLPVKSRDLILLSLALAGLSCGYAWGVGVLLRLNAHCESPGLVTVVRSLSVLLLSLPFAILIGLLCQRPRRAGFAEQAGEGLSRWAAEVNGLWAVAGYLSLRWICPDPRWSLPSLGLMLLVLGMGLAWRYELRTWREMRWTWSASVLCLALLFGASTYSPGDSARLLFSTPVFLALRAGENAELLPYLDDSRLDETFEGREATWTIWHRQGVRLQIRRDGVHDGSCSQDLSLCPHATSEITPIVLPLVLHPGPRSVLMLGTVTAASLSVCTTFPVEEIFCVARDPDGLTLQQRLAQRMSQKDPFQDERVRCQVLDPLHGVRTAHHRAHDVIFCRQEHPCRPCDAGTFTSAFYADVSARLHPEGIFAQVVDLSDLGQDPLRIMLAELRKEFPSVCFVHTGAGQGLFLASPTPRDWFSEETARRAEAKHVRRVCSHLGWDWSVLWSLSAIPPEQVDALLTTSPGTTALPGGHFLCTYPLEILRWAPKQQELSHVLARRATALIAWLDEDSTVRIDVARRLADMSLQRQVIQDHPDYYWAYRRSLRERLQQRPRSEIIQAADGSLRNGLNVEDRRRKEYFQALSAAATHAQPTPEVIQALTQFLEPYDPMVSYFLHQEAAHLYLRAETPQTPEAFRHWIHSIYYSPGNDRSVRNIVQALELLLQHPEMVNDPQERFDYFNGLLDLLKYRWQLRMNSVRAESRFGPVDADRSLDVTQRVLQAMTQLQPETSLSRNDWEARRQVLDRHLVRQVSDYRGRLSRHLGRVAVTPPTQAPPVENISTSTDEIADPEAKPNSTADGTILQGEFVEGAATADTVLAPDEEIIR